MFRSGKLLIEELIPMKKFWTLVLIVGIVIYVLSPIDLFPGPIDDALVAVVGAGLLHGKKEKKSNPKIEE